MFEAVIAVCLALTDGPCRDQLLPGYEGPDLASCQAALAARPPLLEDRSVQGAPRCQLSGAALEFQEIADGVFAHLGQIEEPNAQNRGDVSNIGFVIGDTSIAVIDTGSARWMGEAIWRAIRARSDKPIGHVILTHMHPDHVFGAEALADAGAVVVGHVKLPRGLADRQENYLESLYNVVGPQTMLGTRSVAIVQTVEDTMQIDLGGRVLHLRAWPAAHTGADITVLDMSSSTLFTGDLVFHRHIPALDGNLVGWQGVLAQMQDMDVQRIVPGHGGPVLDWPQGAQDLQRYLNKLAHDTRIAIKDGQRLGIAVKNIAQSEATEWELFEAYNARNATVAFTELEWE